MNNEEWRPVVGHPEYEVSNFGQVRSHKPRGPQSMLTNQTNRGGYVVVKVNGKLRTMHSLVAAAFFIGPQPAEAEIDHGDFDKKNNTQWNLEYVTHVENIRRAAAAGRMSHPGIVFGEKSGRAKLTDATAAEALVMLARGDEHAAVADHFGVARPTIQALAAGRTWRHLYRCERVPTRGPYACSFCGIVGHNARKCTQRVAP